ncbi:MAG: flagellar FlbD family protein [Candidatus Sericytochromatia bacterium]|nr:flagellar FlbD family protein [Candidatus Sericytochromatia bacterium]
MIQLTNLDGKSFVLNAELILSVEATPDTRVILLDDRKYIVREGPDEVVERIMRYRQAIHGHFPGHAPVRAPEVEDGQ